MIDKHIIRLNEMPAAFEFAGGIYPVLFPDFLLLFIGQSADGLGRVLVKVLVGGEQKGYDRFLVYEVSRVTLKKFLTLEIGHFEFVNSALGGMCVLYDISDEMKPYNISINHVSELPGIYLPAQDAEIESHDFMNKKKLFELFSLDSLDASLQELQPRLAEIVEIADAPLINIHLRKGDKVGYGVVDTEVLGNTLLFFIPWMKAMSQKTMVKGKNGKEVPMITQKFDAVYQEAASYSLFLKPVFETHPEGLSIEDMSKSLSDNMYELMANSLSEKQFDQILPNYNLSDFNLYKKIVDFLHKEKVEMDIAFMPSRENQETYRQFNLSKTASQQTRKVYASYNRMETNEMQATGKFIALNLQTRFYKFAGNAENEGIYSGRFSIYIAGEMEKMGFISDYKITFDRVTAIKIGSNPDKFADTVKKVEKIG